MIYKAFGAYLSSDTLLSQIPCVENDCAASDISVTAGDLTAFHERLPENVHCLFRKNEFYFEMPGVGRFLQLNGSRIIYDPDKRASNELLSAYILGPCIGAILHQRQLYPFHGSCVSNQNRSIMICGDSGAGKSTLAAKFIQNGWKLLTDDIAVVDIKDNMAMAYPSYPSQKLWQDSLDLYGGKGSIHSLYAREKGIKFGVSVAEDFCDTPSQLTLIIYLSAEDRPCSISETNDIQKIKCLMDNIYNAFMILPDEKGICFKRCTEIAARVPMVHLIRENGIQSADKLFDMIVSYKGENL